ncbi:pentatricopeptide repeat-containing protein At4g01400, mitochondrial [Cynara cardunculus var. scolymus]|uniref:pentatricopeptide repeat-containing protein At4g01400, mitochondrial n=1 Tax=Cynara cardunculus var. scolymus TaxID=59895 RepID=UPI000D62A9F6|nr:pentatricopeptide repeat-containing protein At4g01400, mitochondrial [Cynara cardunculus var. scolymus]
MKVALIQPNHSTSTKQTLIYMMPSFLSHFSKIVNCSVQTLKPVVFFHSSPTLLLNHNQIPTGVPSPSRIQKLIASQSDPLVAKEIFDLASNAYPGFHHSYATFQTLILKLGRSHHFSLMNSLLSCLKSDHRYTVTPSLFTHIIRIYGDANLPDKALKTFYTILEFNIKPRAKQLNVILEILVSQRNYLHPAFDLFKSAYQYDVSPNVESYNILMHAFCLNGDLSIAYNLFNQMLKRDVVPNVESYRILMQGLCRKSQVNRAVDLLEDMLNKGFVPDSLTYTTLLNSLCRKKKLREAYKLLCRMKVKGCNPDIIHYNTVILGFCRENRAHDACKVLEDMPSNGCLPNLVSYRTLVGGLCSQGLYDEAKTYLGIMVSKGFSPHASIWHGLIGGLCNIGKIDVACSVLDGMLKSGEAPPLYTWMEVVNRVCVVETEPERLEEVLKVEIEAHTRIVEAGFDLQEWLVKKARANGKFRSGREKVRWGLH